MPNIAIDVPLPDSVKSALAEPICISLPQPSKVQLCLPLGGKIQGIADVTKAIPDDCTLTFSLLLQLGPIMANLGCLLNILKLLKPLTDIIGGLTSPTDPSKVAKMTGAVPDFVAAIPPIIGCFAQIALGVPMFIKDLLLLIAKLLKCFAEQLKSIAGLMGGLQLGIQAASASGNAALEAQLKCAMDDANTSAAATMQAIEPITLLLSLAEPLFGIAGVDPIVIPTFGSPEDAAALTGTADTLMQVSAAIITVAENLPSC